MKQATTFSLILFIAIVWSPSFASAQAIPDTTHLLEHGGVNSNLHQTTSGEVSNPTAGNSKTDLTIWNVPFASEVNQLKLSVSNTTGKSLNEVKVRVIEAPEWVHFEAEELSYGSLDKEATAGLMFRFDVSENAPVDQPGTVHVQATSRAGGIWNKMITMQINAPTEFELLDNYPNPFNPSTTIEWRLPSQMHVKVNVFNVMGQKIAELADGEFSSGQHQIRWEASGMASGLYFYRVSATGPEGRQHIEVGRMLLIK